HAGGASIAIDRLYNPGSIARLSESRAEVGFLNIHVEGVEQQRDATESAGVEIIHSLANGREEICLIAVHRFNEQRGACIAGGGEAAFKGLSEPVALSARLVRIGIKAAAHHADQHLCAEPSREI